MTSVSRNCIIISSPLSLSRDSCGIYLENGTLVITGGLDPATNETWGRVLAYNSSGFVTSLPDLHHDRDDHACSTFFNDEGHLVRSL